MSDDAPPVIPSRGESRGQPRDNDSGDEQRPPPPSSKPPGETAEGREKRRRDKEKERRRADKKDRNRDRDRERDRGRDKKKKEKEKADGSTAAAAAAAAGGGDGEEGVDETEIKRLLSLHRKKEYDEVAALLKKCNRPTRRRFKELKDAEKMEKKARRGASKRVPDDGGKTREASGDGGAAAADKEERRARRRAEKEKSGRHGGSGTSKRHHRTGSRIPSLPAKALLVGLRRTSTELTAVDLDTLSNVLLSLNPLEPEPNEQQSKALNTDLTMPLAASSAPKACQDCKLAPPAARFARRSHEECWRCKDCAAAAIHLIRDNLPPIEEDKGVAMDTTDVTSDTADHAAAAAAAPDQQPSSATAATTSTTSNAPRDRNSTVFTGSLPKAVLLKRKDSNPAVGAAPGDSALASGASPSAAPAASAAVLGAGAGAGDNNYGPVPFPAGVTSGQAVIDQAKASGAGASMAAPAQAAASAGPQAQTHYISLAAMDEAFKEMSFFRPDFSRKRAEAVLGADTTPVRRCLCRMRTDGGPNDYVISTKIGENPARFEHYQVSYDANRACFVELVSQEHFATINAMLEDWEYSPITALELEVASADRDTQLTMVRDSILAEHATSPEGLWWFHGPLARDEAENRLLGRPAGTYLLRRNGQGMLALTYTTAPGSQFPLDHTLVLPCDDLGGWRVGDVEPSVGDTHFADLTDMAMELNHILVCPLPAPHAAAQDAAANPVVTAAIALTKVGVQADVNVVGGGAGGGGGGGSSAYPFVVPAGGASQDPLDAQLFKEAPFYHGTMSRSAAEALLFNQPTGAFLLRKGGRGDIVLSCVDAPVVNVQTTAISHVVFLNSPDGGWYVDGSPAIVMASPADVWEALPGVVRVPVCRPGTSMDDVPKPPHRQLSIHYEQFPASDP